MKGLRYDELSNKLPHANYRRLETDEGHLKFTEDVRIILVTKDEQMQWQRCEC